MIRKHEIGTIIKVGIMAEGQPRPGVIVDTIDEGYLVEWLDEVYDQVNRTPYREDQIEVLGALSN
ncbi:hypothetical protein [Mesorhizobium sp. DCY119]|uniref:hypothetical protein n=1 Tax=Mesorhizobium sp. DCY119 TaxID=2108445 RepID=UPI000E741965|nr:hypothetical protein [Mesorhizobium sp. DCY119]RJG40874.1 hypothetical protein D3Y55_26985 [Mesorhizobium sp. DCY119]